MLLSRSFTLREAAMPSIANPNLLGAGMLLLLVGIWLWRWSSRQVIDVKGAAIGAAWQGVKKGQVPVMPDEIKSKFQTVSAQSSNTGKAVKVASIGARHYIGRLVGALSFVVVLAALGLIAAGIWWK
jgi:hypothetical protein